MARATNPGAPQRVSAHVVPKAPSFSNDDEEEKTTIESGGWEEEASTTVEQGEVAEKVRALALGAAQQARSNTAITSTTGSGVSDEPTVDDQRASAALALLPPPSIGRLVITQGSDTGRQLEVRPGKTYTIGRGIDNDLVLTDITASRKHFDIRHEAGSWILADRASGNGTLVNSRIEDAPFMLASGDTIEVGNTAFRFELVTTAISLPGVPREAAGAAREAPAAGARDARATAAATVEDPSDSRELMPTPAVHAPPVSRDLISPAVLREASAAAAREADEAHEAATDRAPDRMADRVPEEVAGFDGPADDDLELSTVSGKPMQEAVTARPSVTASRPKTLPPPSPLPRPRTQTGRPPLSFVNTRSQQMAAVQPTQPPIPSVALAATMAPTMAPAMAPTMAAAMAPTLSPMHAVPALPQPATTLPLPQMANRPPLAPGLLDSSHGPALPQLTQGTSLPATLPGQGPAVLPNRAPRLPFSYPSAPELLPQRPSAILRAPVNVAAAHPSRDATSTALVQPISYSSSGQAVVAAQPVQRMVPLLSQRTLIALGLLGLAVVAAVATLAIRSSAGPSNSPGRASTLPASATAPAALAPPPAASPPTVTPIPSTPAPAPGSGGTRAAADRTAAGAPSPSSDKAAAASPSTSPAAAAPPAAPTASGTAPAGPVPEAPTSAPVAPRSAAADKSPSPSGASAPVASGAAPLPSSSPGTAAASPAAPVAPTSTGPAVESAHPAASDKPRGDAGSDKLHADASTARTTRQAKHTEPRKPEHKTEVAAAPPSRPRAHGGRSLADVKAEATGLYRSKNFSGAALAITSALSGFSGDDGRDLKSIAGIYSQLGKAYSIGMAPGTRPIEAYQNLLRASDYDREVGGAYAQELHDKLVAIAPRAATSYMATKSYEQAFQAVRKAEELGSRSDDLKIVRQYLEDKAKELLRTARSEIASDPDAAKQKLRQIQGMVERQNTLWQQASKLLNGP